jgi:peptidyl-prolyl cis-trans isomerase C
VKTQIVAKLSRDKKTKEFDEWMKSLRENAKITVDDKALEAIEVQAAQTMPAMGQPGQANVQMVPPAAPAPSPHK